MGLQNIVIDRHRHNVGRKDLIDDDNTFLPPALSSYSIALLNEKNKTNNNTESTTVSSSMNEPVTGVYKIDFPENRDRLRQKLSVHFNEYNNDHLTVDKTTTNEISNQDTLKSNNSYSNHSLHTLQTHEGSPYSLSKSLSNTINNLSGNLSAQNLSNSPHSLIDVHEDGEDKVSSQNSESRMGPVRRLRGRRFGKLLGPPQRTSKFSSDQNIETNRESNEYNQTFNDQENYSTPKQVSPMKQFSPFEQQVPSFNDLNLNHEKEIEFRERIDQQKKLFEVHHRSSELENVDKRKPLSEVPSNHIESFRRPKLPKLNSPLSHRSSIISPPKSTNERQSPQVVSQVLNDIPAPKRLSLPPAVLSSIQSRKPESLDSKLGLGNLEKSKIEDSERDDTNKRKTIGINGNQYEKLELLGRGGTSKVYKVKLLSNNKIYAIKKVVFDQFDDICIKGFKGEIDLLIKLKNSSRVVKLIDYAIGEGSIYLVMECGEIDLAHALQGRLNFNNHCLDINFVRFNAVEIFKCVEAVHNSEIVHSDLKPANFLFVKGVLKIIDFGIADSVPDHTANIYKESQIGTPSYMAPEALIDTNHSLLSQNTSNGSDVKNTWKVGKPSDVWSCGCIIYQMIYGKPPYGGYSGNQRIMAIINPSVKILYPSTGLGGVKVPKAAIELMKNCLARNPNERWTIKQCLESDFLQPKIVNEGFIRDLVHSAVNFGYNNRTNGNGLITSDVYDRLVETVLKQINDLNVG